MGMGECVAARGLCVDEGEDAEEAEASEETIEIEGEDVFLETFAR